MEITNIQILPIQGVRIGSGAGQGFKKKLIFQTWNFKLLIGQKDVPLQGELSNVLIFLKQRQEALGTGIPTFPISSTKMSKIYSATSPKFRLLIV